MAGIGKLAKVLWKGISYLPKKAHALQEPFVAPAGGKLSIGKKLTNVALETTEYTSYAGLIGSLAITVSELITGITADDKDTANKAFALGTKGIDPLLLGLVGFCLGGPIGTLAGLAYGVFGEKSPFVNLVGTLAGRNSQELKALENEFTKEAKARIKDLYNSGLDMVGLSVEKDQTQQEDIDADPKAVEELIKELENLEVGQTVTVPEIKAESGKIVMQIEDQEVELEPGDKITRTEEGLEITKANAQKGDKEEEEEEEVKQQDETSQEESVQQQNEQQPETVRQSPPTNNLFGGEIHEITKKNIKIEKGDCLWNIAKRELQAVNQGKTITNAQILKQVKEFGRLNPNIKNLDLIYPEDNLKLTA